MSDWINSNEGHIRTRNNAFFLTLLLCVFILIEMALMEGGEEKVRQRERSWSRTASSQLQQRGPADLDPGWAGMILAKQLREMTAVRQGQTDRDSSLSPALLSMFFHFLSPSCNGYWFFTTKQEALSTQKCLIWLKKKKKRSFKRKSEWKKRRKCWWHGCNVRGRDWGSQAGDPVSSLLGCVEITRGMSKT